MHRKKLLDTLSRYKPAEYERDILAELVAHIRNTPDCFERHHVENARHLSASVFLVNQKNEILNLSHKKIGTWTLPGGHCDGNHDVLDVARTELAEETGITMAKFDVLPLEIVRYDYEPSIFGYCKSIYDICYLARIDTAQQDAYLKEPEKHSAVKWFSADTMLHEARNSRGLKKFAPHLIG